MMDSTVMFEMLLTVKTIIVYLILVLFLIDLARADSYNKIARIIKILLFPLLLIFNVHYKKINIGLLFAALLINFVSFYVECPGHDLGTVFNRSIIETAKIMIGLLKFLPFHHLGHNYYSLIHLVHVKYMDPMQHHT